MPVIRWVEPNVGPQAVAAGPALVCECGMTTLIRSMSETECAVFYCVRCGEGHRFAVRVGMTEIRVAYLGTLPAVDVIVECQP